MTSFFDRDIFWADCQFESERREAQQIQQKLNTVDPMTQQRSFAPDPFEQQQINFQFRNDAFQMELEQRENNRLAKESLNPTCNLQTAHFPSMTSGYSSIGDYIDNSTFTYENVEEDEESSFHPKENSSSDESSEDEYSIKAANKRSFRNEYRSPSTLNYDSDENQFEEESTEDQFFGGASNYMSTRSQHLERRITEKMIPNSDDFSNSDENQDEEDSSDSDDDDEDSDDRLSKTKRKIEKLLESQMAYHLNKLQMNSNLNESN